MFKMIGSVLDFLIIWAWIKVFLVLAFVGALFVWAGAC